MTLDHHNNQMQICFVCRDIIANKSKAAAGLCDWAINIVKYYDVVSEVEPKRLELAGANDKLAAANTTLKQVQDKVALLNAQVQELEDQYNKVGVVLQQKTCCLFCASKAMFLSKLMPAMPFYTSLSTAHP